MENDEIRRANLALLIDEAGSAAALEERTGTDATYLRNIRNGVRDMGTRLARRLEEKLGKPRGWMDTPQKGNTSADAEQLLAHYERASPEWQLALRMLAQLPVEQQPSAAAAINRALAVSGLSESSEARKPLYNSRHGNKSEAQDGKIRKRTT